MFLDILNQNNYISYNITLAQIMGLEGAVYCSELLNIYKKAHSKNKIIGDEYFKLDRKYVFQRTTISIEKQLEIDAKWEKIKLMFKHEDNPDIIKLDTQLIAGIIAGENVKLREDLSGYLNANISAIKTTKHKKRINALKESIKCSDLKVLEALRNWVDALSTYTKNSKVSEQSIEIFQDTLYRYTQGDTEKALIIIKIATVQKYPDCQWAINLYEKDQRMRAQNSVFSNTRMPKVTVSKRKKATKDSLGDEIF